MEWNAFVAYIQAIKEPYSRFSVHKQLIRIHRQLAGCVCLCVCVRACVCVGERLSIVNT